jgi:hypothetical protein
MFLCAKHVSVLLLPVFSILAGCADPKVKEKSLERERDSARSELETKEEQHGYDLEFAARYQAYLKAHNGVLIAANRYLKTGNEVLANDVKDANREKIQSMNDGIAQALSLFEMHVLDLRSTPPTGDAFVTSVQKLGELVQSALTAIDAAEVAVSDIKDAETGAFKNSATLAAMTADQKAQEALNYVDRQAALDYMINSYNALEKSVPRLTCYTFPAQCKD